MPYRLIDEWEGGFGWLQEEWMGRASHALVVDGAVWVVDPVGDYDLEERVRALGEPAGVVQLLDRHNRACVEWAQLLRVPYVRAWDAPDLVPFQVVPVLATPVWREVALWETGSRTLVCADALGTLPYFLAPGERLGVHPLLRLRPPKLLGTLAPERVLVGHGEGLFADAADATATAVRTARTRLLRAWAHAARSRRR